MYIKLTIIDNNSPSKHIFKSNYAIETMLVKITEIYFGKEASLKIEDLLKLRLKDDENGI